MAINGADINAAAINSTGDRTFSIFTEGFEVSAIEGFFVFRDLDLPADFYVKAEIDNTKAREIVDITRPVDKDEP